MEKKKIFTDAIDSGEKEMENPLLKLMKKYQKGNRPVFNLGPFLSLELMGQEKLEFNKILQNSAEMTKAARSNFNLGFESTVLPFDLNVEAEVLGATVQYHDGYDGIPIYPTICNKWVSKANDIVIPDNMAEKGRIPVITACITRLKDELCNEGAIGMFLPGPFTLAGQVMDMDDLFVMVLKQPDVTKDIFARLTEAIIILRNIYINAGVDFIVIEEGGATAISPKLFRKLILPGLKNIFMDKLVPHVLSLTGSSNRFIELMLECKPHGIGVDQECDIAGARGIVPENIPLFSFCGNYDMLAAATPETVMETVRTYLDKGVTAVGPPADMYPPGKLENIHAFVNAIRQYNG